MNVEHEGCLLDFDSIETDTYSGIIMSSHVSMLVFSVT